MVQSRILALSGSMREGSFNTRLVKIAAGGARKAGAEVTVVNLADYPLPIYDQDLEQERGLPERALELKRLFVDHQGLLIAAPEYNSSITPLLKNTIDWVSRPSEGEEPLVAYRGTVAVLMSASPGALGGLRGLVHVRSILSSIGVLVLPDQVAVPHAMDAFDEDGTLKDVVQNEKILGLGAELVRVTGRLSMEDTPN